MEARMSVYLGNAFHLCVLSALCARFYLAESDQRLKLAWDMGVSVWHVRVDF